MDISEYQRQADSTDESSKAKWVGLTQNVLGLSEKVGELTGAIKLRLRDPGTYSSGSFRSDFEKHIGETLWYLSAVATHFLVDLDEIAKRNLASNRARWGTHRDPQGRLFHGRRSEQYPADEQWPNSVQLVFDSTMGPTEQSWLPVTRIAVDGEPFGDPIDDNTPTPDGYRFHDILHFAFAVYLDWSPVVRKLMKNKRKSSREVDKFEDGAKARDTEESVSNLIHKHAVKNHLFDTGKRLDSDLLENLQFQVHELEVRDRTAHEWERCILAAYDVYRPLLQNKGGMVNVDFKNATLTYQRSTAS